MKRAVLPLALALAGCASVPGPARPTAALGQVAVVDGVRVRPLAIIEDSRCPINVVCVWAGRIVVRTEIRGSGVPETRDLELGKLQPIAGGTLTLTAAEPAPLAGTRIPPSAYRFTYSFGDRWSE
jgi:hypothetical protein